MGQTCGCSQDQAALEEGTPSCRELAAIDSIHRNLKAIKDAKTLVKDKKIQKIKSLFGRYLKKWLLLILIYFRDPQIGIKPQAILQCI